MADFARLLILFGAVTLVIVVLLFGAANMVSVGLLGEYVGRIAVEVRQRPLYIVKGTAGQPVAGDHRAQAWGQVGPRAERAVLHAQRCEQVLREDVAVGALAAIHAARCTSSHAWGVSGMAVPRVRWWGAPPERRA